VFVKMQNEAARLTGVRAATKVIETGQIALADAVEYGLSRYHAE
jgi:hypothetical protein